MREGKLAVVEYLRAGAALAVTWFHLTNVYPWGGVRFSGAPGWLGVAVFFVISGFVLPYAIWGRHQASYEVFSHFGAFAWRRLVRIEPPYLVSVLLAVALWHASAMVPGYRGAAPDVSAGQILAHIGYAPAAFGYSWLQEVYWTLSYEFCFYAILGLSYPLLLRYPLQTMATLVLGAMLASTAVRGTPDAHIPLFAMGAAVFLAQRSVLSTTQLWGVLCLASLASGLLHWPVALAGLITSFVLLFGTRIRAGGRLHSIGLFLGAISYSLYITHLPIGLRIVNLGTRVVDSEIGRLLFSLGALAVCVVFAGIFWWVIERRFVALAARLGRGAGKISEGPPMAPALPRIVQRHARGAALWAGRDRLRARVAARAELGRQALYRGQAGRVSTSFTGSLALVRLRSTPVEAGWSRRSR